MIRRGEVYDEVYREVVNYELDVLMILEELDLEPEFSVLDLACGTGKHLLEFDKHTNGTLIGIDLADAMLDCVRGRTATVAGDMCQEHTWKKIPAGLDLVTCLFNSLNYITSRNKLGNIFDQAWEHLGKGGRFAFQCFDPDSITENDMALQFCSQTSAYSVLRLTKIERHVVKGHLADSASFVMAYAVAHNRGAREVEAWTERHDFRLWTQEELAATLEVARFKVVTNTKGGNRNGIWIVAQKETQAQE